jgi:hypothetical protein
VPASGPYPEQGDTVGYYADFNFGQYRSSVSHNLLEAEVELHHISPE